MCSARRARGSGLLRSGAGSVTSPCGRRASRGRPPRLQLASSFSPRAGWASWACSSARSLWR
eukprot:9822932-Alexandrium_andersonii.AAC.1